MALMTPRTFLHTDYYVNVITNCHNMIWEQSTGRMQERELPQATGISASQSGMITRGRASAGIEPVKCSSSLSGHLILQKYVIRGHPNNHFPLTKRNSPHGASFRNGSEINNFFLPFGNAT
jgi:hypothetical protein